MPEALRASPGGNQSQEQDAALSRRRQLPQWEPPQRRDRAITSSHAASPWSPVSLLLPARPRPSHRRSGHLSAPPAPSLPAPPLLLLPPPRSPVGDGGRWGGYVSGDAAVDPAPTLPSLSSAGGRVSQRRGDLGPMAWPPEGGARRPAPPGSPEMGACGSAGNAKLLLRRVSHLSLLSGPGRGHPVLTPSYWDAKYSLPLHRISATQRRMGWQKRAPISFFRICPYWLA